MSNIDKVTSTFGKLKYMQQPEAEFLRDFIIRHDISSVLEIGFYHGKSTAYFAAILEDLDRGHIVTIDKTTARLREPNVETVLTALGLSNRVTTIHAHRSYTWELGKMIQVNPRPAFDLCYFDGGHTWDTTGFGFVLVDMLLRPGGWIILDDLHWTVDEASKQHEKPPKSWQRLDPDERKTPGVKLVFDTLVPHLGYTDLQFARDGNWGIARKPLTMNTAAQDQRKAGAA